MISPGDWLFGSGQPGQSWPRTRCCVDSGLLGTLPSEAISPPEGFLSFLDSQPLRGFVFGASPLFIPYPTSGHLEAEEPADPMLATQIPLSLDLSLGRFSPYNFQHREGISWDTKLSRGSKLPKSYAK